MASMRKRGRHWYFAYIDGEGRRVERKGCPDRRVTEGLAAQAEAEAARIRAGLSDPKAAGYLAHEARPLAEHLDDFRADLTGKGDVPRYVQQVIANAARILSIGGMSHLSDLSPARVQVALAKLRSGGLSLQTVNHSLRHIKGFSRWLHRDGRTREDALAHLTGFNVATDRRHDRRALSEAEALALVRVAETGPVVLGMTGIDRAMLYRLALGTGFRANELRSLTPESFDLDADPPAVRVAAAYSKRRRDDRQPIRPDLAAALRPWVARKPPGRPVFAMPEKPARMMRSDLKAAGIAYRDASGRVADFHALRHTFVSMVIRGGASVKVAQELARHSTPVLTIGRYAHVTLHDQTGALDALPDLSSPAPDAEPAAMQATGTEGQHISNSFAAHLPHGGDGEGHFLTAADGTGLSSPEPSMDRKSLLETVFDGSGRLLTAVHPAGLEPATLSSEDCWLIRAKLIVASTCV